MAILLDRWGKGFPRPNWGHDYIKWRYGIATDFWGEVAFFGGEPESVRGSARRQPRLDLDLANRHRSVRASRLEHQLIAIACDR